MIGLVLFALVTAPVGWQGGANRELVEETGRVGHFGGVHGVIEAERWDAPQPGVVLYVTRVAANVGSPEDAAAAELATFTHGTLAPVVKAGALDADTTWQDGDVTGATRMIIAATADRIVAVKGECFEGAGAAAKDVAACVQALATLDAGIPVADRVPLTPPAAPAAPAVAPTLTTRGLTEQHVTMPPMSVPPAAPGPDRRPIYTGAGLVVIAAIFWWNRRRRAAAHDNDR